MINNFDVRKVWQAKTSSNYGSMSNPNMNYDFGNQSGMAKTSSNYGSMSNPNMNYDFGNQSGMAKTSSSNYGGGKFLKSFRGNPFAEGFKKYVVVAPFVASHYQLGESKKRQFKKGMNLYAKLIMPTSTSENNGMIGMPPPTLVSYAGFIIPNGNVKEKGRNVLEEIQKFFSRKSNRNFA